MQCQHCGAGIEGEGRFCDECGKPLRDGGSGTPASSSQSTSALGLATKPALATAPKVFAPLVADAKAFHHAKYSKKWNNVRTALSRWNQLIRGLDVSSTDFYRAVRSAIQSRRVPDVDLALIEIPEGGVFSAK